MNENLQALIFFIVMCLFSVFLLFIGWKIGNLIRNLKDYATRIGEMLAWFENAKKNEKPWEKVNITLPLPNRVTNSATEPEPKKNELPFWEDLEQLEEEMERIEKGEAGSDGVTDPLDYVRRVAEAITDLKERNQIPVKK